MLSSDDAARADWRATSECESLASTLQDEISRSLKKLQEARETLGTLGQYRTRSLSRQHGECVEDLKVLEEAIRLFNDATDVCFDNDLPAVRRLVAEYREISGYDSTVFEPCEEEA